MQKESSYNSTVSQILQLILITLLFTTCTAIPRSLDSSNDAPPSFELTGDIVNTSEESSGQSDESLQFKVFFPEETVEDISKSSETHEAEIFSSQNEKSRSSQEHTSNLDGSELLLINEPTTTAIAADYFEGSGSESSIPMLEVTSDESDNEIAIQVTLDQELIDEIALGMNSQNYSIVLEYVPKKSIAHTELLTDIIKTAYKDGSENIYNIVWLVDHVLLEDQKLRVLESLWKQIKENNDLQKFQTFVFGCYLKLLMDESQSTDAAALLRFETLKNDLPEVIHSMFWDHVCIRNVRYCEYLYADEQLFKPDRRHIFTWRQKGKKQYHWVIEGSNQCRSFSIKNTNKEYLYAASDGNYAKNRRQIFSWVPGNTVPQGYWKFEQEQNSTIFRLKNIHHNEYLFAGRNDDSFDDKRRSVFAGLAKSTNPCSKWEIKVCN